MKKFLSLFVIGFAITLVLADALMIRNASVEAASGQIFATAYTANALGAAANVATSGAHYLRGICLQNNNAAQVYVEFFNVQNPTLGTTTPVSPYPIPASASLCFNSDVNLEALGNNGFAMAAVTTIGGSTAGSVSGVVHYQ